MLEYYPWSRVVLKKMMGLQREGKIPTLDIELTAKCSAACCVYCDSKPKVCPAGAMGEIDMEEMRKMLNEAVSCGLQWVYTCGLGEPLEDIKFWDMIHLMKSYNVRLSMFSNGLFIQDIYAAKELKENGVNIILKMDTFEEENFDKILGRKGTARKIYAARDYLLEAGYGRKEKYTDIAFSIVPTSLSMESIPDVIGFCKENGIFASIGELEQAGEANKDKIHQMLAISKEDILELKKIADEYAGESYARPICPCILTGLHIDNFGSCMVDKETGFNCKWFLLRDPQMIELGNIKQTGIKELFEKANAYRRNCFKTNHDAIRRSCSVCHIFGGCGGNPCDILKLVEEEYE